MVLKPKMQGIGHQRTGAPTLAVRHGRMQQCGNLEQWGPPRSPGAVRRGVEGPGPWGTGSSATSTNQTLCHRRKEAMSENSGG